MIGNLLKFDYPIIGLKNQPSLSLVGSVPQGMGYVA